MLTLVRSPDPSRMQEHVLHDRIGALAVADDLVEIGGDHADQILGLFASGLVQGRLF